MDKKWMYFLGAAVVGYAFATNFAQVPLISDAINVGYNFGLNGTFSTTAS